MTLSRQEIDHPTSSSSSSTSPTMTSSTVSSDSVSRQERGDLCGIDSYPVTVSSKHVERQERRDLFSSGTPEEELLTKPTENPKPNKNEDPDLERGDLVHSDIPEWLQEFRENLVDDRVPEYRDSHASSSHELSLEPTPARSADLGKHSVYTQFPKDRNCEICQRTKITRAPVQKTHWRKPCLVQKILVIWLQQITQSSQWRLWISKQSSTCSRGAGLGHLMDPVISVQNKNFSGNTKELGAPNRKPEVIVHWQFIGIWQSLWRSLLESLYVDTTQIGNKWDCWESSAQSERRYICSIVAIRSQWKLVGRFHAMPYLSAKYSRSLVWWRTPYERRFGEPFNGPIIPFGSLFECYLVSAKDQSRIHHFGKKVLPGLFLGYALHAGGALEGWHDGCRHGGVGNDGRIRNLL